MYSLNTTSKDYISEMFVVFLQDLLYSYVFCNIQCAKTALQKLVKSEALKVTVYRVYTDWHMLILILLIVRCLYLFFFFIFSLTPLHWRIILYFPNAIKCIFFLKSINYRFFASNIYNSCIFPSVMNWYYFLIFLWNKCITHILLYTYRFSYS